jgi:hypothetical protein
MSLRERRGGWWSGYKVHAVSFEGTEEVPTLFPGAETFFFFFCVGEGCGVVFRGGDGTEVGKCAQKGR